MIHFKFQFHFTTVPGVAVRGKQLTMVLLLLLLLLANRHALQSTLNSFGLFLVAHLQDNCYLPQSVLLCHHSDKTLCFIVITFTEGGGWW